MLATRFVNWYRRDVPRWMLPMLALVAIVVWVSVHFTHPIPPARIVLASGPPHSLYVQFAHRYREILAQHGVTVVERLTDGAAENLDLLMDPKSGVDVAFMQGGVATMPAPDGIIMLASLYYEPVWIFYRNATPLTQINQLRGRRIAVGLPRSGTRALVMRILTANGVTETNSKLLSIGGDESLGALRAGEVDVAMFVDGATTPATVQALRDPALRLLSLDDAMAYQRRFAYVTALTLPRGTVDLEATIPARDVELIGTKAMLAAREGFHPALVNLLLEAAHQLHAEQGDFEAGGEFPGLTPVDLPVSPEAQQHTRFGPSLLYRYLPFWVATIVERIAIVGLPLLIILIPVLRFLPPMLRWRTRSRFYRWYAELAALERRIAEGHGTMPVADGLRELDRIDRQVAQIRVPPVLASEAYTLRTHIDLVRHGLEGKNKPES